VHFVARYRRRAGLVLGFSICGLAAGAEAQEYCVACTEPPAVYRCVIEGARPGGRHPLQKLCVIAMTKEGRHAACSVKGGTVFDCSGPVKRVPWAAYNTAVEPAPAAPPRAAKAPPGEPPRTVEEMVRRSNEKTAEQLRQANEKIGQDTQSVGQGLGAATRKTWACISSLFTRCGD
jgi:hypothetical protein